MDIKDMIDLIAAESVMPTQHFMYRIENRGITIDEVLYAVANGEIIEDYPTDYPYPSALILGYTLGRRAIHTVVGVGNGCLWLITAYVPDPKSWEADLRIRKAVKK